MTSAPEPVADIGQTRKRRRVKRRRPIFLWVFLAFNALMILWLVTGISSVASDTTCDPTLTQEACDAARGIGGGIGALLIFALWVGGDIILGLGYLVAKLARRER